jgi:putative transposase
MILSVFGSGAYPQINSLYNAGSKLHCHALSGDINYGTEQVMLRQARLDAPGVLHHVMSRGIEGTKIFRNQKDRQDFLSRLEDLAQEKAWGIYAWTLMPNHFHLLVQTARKPLSANMRKLRTGYVVNFN